MAIAISPARGDEVDMCYNTSASSHPNQVWNSQYQAELDGAFRYRQGSDSGWGFCGLFWPSTGLLAANSLLGKATWRHILAKGKSSVLLSHRDVSCNQRFAHHYREYNTELAQMNAVD
jgi:hypothetical protein